MKTKRELGFLLAEIRDKRFELLLLETWLENASLRSVYCNDRKLSVELDRLRRAVSRWLSVSGGADLKRYPTFPQYSDF